MSTDNKEIRNQFAEEDINTLEKEGMMVITDTIHGVLQIEFEGGYYKSVGDDGIEMLTTDDREQFKAHIAAAYTIEIQEENTSETEENQEKVLIFEGAGWESAESNEVGNVRLRTRIKNDYGQLIYLEITGIQRSKYNPQPFEWTGYVNHLFFEKDEKTNYSPEISDLEKSQMPFDMKSIVSWVNTNLGLKFTSMKVDNGGEVRVHDTKSELCCA